MPKHLPLCLAAAGLTATLFAADFWEKKPFTQWTDKEVQRILTNSPWVRDAATTMDGRSGGSRGGGKRGGGGGGGGGGMGGGEGIGGGEGMGAGGGGGRGGGAGGGMGGGGMDASGLGGMTTLTATITWMSALPVKQAMIKRKFGAEAETSEEARKLLANQESHYIIKVDKLPQNLARMNPARMQEALKKGASLSAKSKDPIYPEDIKFAQTEKSIIILFLFPRTTPFQLEDKEVEFSTKLGGMEFKRKFKLQDMVFGGKLEL